MLFPEGRLTAASYGRCMRSSRRAAFLAALALLMLPGSGAADGEELIVLERVNTIYVVRSVSGSDTVDAGAGGDEIDGGSGNDTLTGGPGSDLSVGGGGNDPIKARDGRRDRIRCGSELDLVLADRHDVTGADCERVRRR